MKAKKYFIFSSAIQIISALIDICFVRGLLAEILHDDYSFLNPKLQNKMISTLESYGIFLLVSLLIVIIIVNILEIRHTKRENLVRNKGFWIFVNIVLFTIAGTVDVVIMVFALLNVAILIAAKRPASNNFKDNLDEIPNVQSEEALTKKKFSAFLIIAVYFSQFFLNIFIPNSLNFNELVKISALIDIVIFVIITGAFWSELKESFIVFFRHRRSYAKYIFSLYGYMLLTGMFVNTLCFSLMGNDGTLNQQIIERLPYWYSLPTTVIFAPIVEEIVFRGALRKVIPSKKIYFIFSGLIFGFCHTMHEPTIARTIILALPYVIVGFYCAHSYIKTENMICNIAIHMMNNSLAMVLTIFLNMTLVGWL